MSESKLKKSTVVLKFGGTSVADAQCIKRICSIATKEYIDHNVVVVVSAMGKTTDSLMGLAGQLAEHPEGRELDMLLSTGEQVTISLVAMHLNHIGYDAISLVGWQAGFVTEREHNKARIAEIKKDKIQKKLEAGKIVIVAGFQGVTSDGELTTLGRGGSDTSAVAIAAALQAERCDIYTDVDGIYSTDPRLVESAKKLDYISYEEMIELASLGAKVLHPRSVELAKKYDVDLFVRSSFKPEVSGTKVISLREASDMELTQAVTGVAVDLKQAKIGLIGVPNRPGLASRIFTFLAKNSISVDIILQSIPRSEIIDVAFTVSKEQLHKALPLCNELCDDIGAEMVIHDDTIAKLSVVGAGMLNKPGIASTMFEALYKAGINIEMISTSEIKISCIIAEEDVDKGVKAVHNTFYLAKATEEIIV